MPDITSLVIGSFPHT